MKLIVAWTHRLILLFLFATVVAGCDKFGDVTSGVGGATKNLADKISGDKSSNRDESAADENTNNQSASGTIGGSESEATEKSGDEDTGSEDESEADAEIAVADERSSKFNLIFEMSYQSCSSCGIWFDSAELVIVHSKGRFTARQSGSLLIKEAPYFQGRFNADISSIPQSAVIQSATLYMRLNAHEGISNDDYTSSISVYSNINGSTRFIREITARDDIKGKGYSKANPVVPVDFTRYTKGL